MPQLAPVRTRWQIGATGLVYLVVALLILGAAGITQNNLLFWAFGLMIGGLVVSVILAFLTLRSVRVERLLPDHAVVGQPLVIRYHLLNPKPWLPAFNLIVQETWGRGHRGWRKTGPLAEQPSRLGGLPVGWVLHLGLRQVTQAEAICWPRRRGLLHFERILISTSFPFGVVKRVLEFSQPGKVLVYPRLYRMNRTLWYRLTLADPAGNLQLDRGGGSEEFFGLRSYRPGDSLRAIDWKHSAKAQTLIAREWTQPTPPKLVLALDLTGLPRTPEDTGLPKSDTKCLEAPAKGSKGNSGGSEGSGGEWEDLLDLRERAISLAASILCGAHVQGYQAGLVILGAAAPSYRPHHSVPHRGRMLETLARLELPTTPLPAQRPTLEPTVLIHTGAGGVRASRRCIVIDVRDMAQFVRETEGDTEKLLARGVSPRSKRQRLKLGESWT